MSRGMGLHGNIRPILGAIRSVPVPAGPEHPAPAIVVAPFVTISRQPGAGAWTIARQLVESLNQSMPAEQPWTCWDRELVEKVAADHKLSAPLIDSLEDREHHWFSDFLESLSFSDGSGQADESKVYGRVAGTIRALALTGRVVIVGRGGVFITHRMAGGIHIRLVAPVEKRVEFMAREYSLTHDQAVARVKELERNRQAFYRRYWPNETMTPEMFTLTINSGQVDQATIVEMVASVVKRLTAAHR